MIDFGQINYWAVLAATIATMILGFLWYSPVLFGNAWVKERGIKMEDIQGGGPVTYVLTAATALVGALALALLLTAAGGPAVGSGLTVGLLIGISISVKIGMNYLFENKTLRLYLITIGYHLATYLMMGLIIGAM